MENPCECEFFLLPQSYVMAWNIPPPRISFCVVSELYKTVLASVPTGKMDVSSIFFPLQEGSDKLVRAGLLICTCRGSFSLKGAWEIPSDAPFICLASRPACNLRDIVVDNRTCPLWTQRTISRGGVKSDSSPVPWISLSFSLQPYHLSLTIICQTAPAH